MEKVRELISLASSWFSRLTTREKRLVVLAAASSFAMLLLIVLVSFSTTASKLQNQTKAKLQNLSAIQGLASTYHRAKQERMAAEQQLQRNDIHLISYITEKGTEAGLDIRTINPKGEAPIGDDKKIIESSVEVTLTDITLDKFHRFLTSVESGPGVVKVKYIRVEPRVANETLTAWATIATYSLKRE